MPDLAPYRGSDPEPLERAAANRSLNNPLNPTVPWRLAKRLLWLPDRARNMGINLRGGKGSGKSTLMAMLAWFDLVRGVPLVVMDPVGSVIDGLLWRICRLPPDYQQKLWPKIIYAEISGKYGYVTPFPLYYQLPGDTLYSASQRYPDVIRRVDPWLNSAPIQGFNSLWKFATYVGMVLTSFGYQITEASHLLAHPQSWLPLLSKAVVGDPELLPALDFFRDYARWNEQLRAGRTEAFSTKIAPFNLQPVLRATHGFSSPAIQWEEVIHTGRAVLLDFRHLRDHETRRFELIWSFHYLLDYLRYRGAGRHRPLALYIDELASFFHMQSLDVNPLREDLDELANVRMRSHMVWLCLAYQEAYQLDERTQKTLLTLGTQILGSTADMQAALSTSQQFFPVDPYKVKRYEPVWGSVLGMPQIVDHRPIEFSLEEQQFLSSYKVKDQPAFHFLVRPAQGEGTATGKVYPISIRNFDKGIWVNEEVVEEARALLSKRDGLPVETVLAEIEARTKGLQSATIKGYAPHASLRTTQRTDETIYAEEDILREEKHVPSNH